MFDENSHEHFMRRCIELAAQAEAEGEVPVGAVLVHQGEVIAEGYNRPISSHDPSAHAEMIALREAAKNFQNYRLADVTLYVTLEPCSMCAGAMVHARVAKLVYGTKDPRTGAAGSVFDLLNGEFLNHRVECIEGVLQEECSQQLKTFFQQKRLIKT
ncbi:MAG: tRNA adenosine(34) deaminase TadA [Gammaproteobacteria bacterium]|nr:tRNA adenosine(34) deaminase TadA [Gammaproteobacteria bacterium]